MEERRPSPILVAVTVVTALLILYIAGYFWLSNPGTITSFGGPVRLARFFPNETWATIYRPAAAIESAVRGREVYATYESQ